MALIFLMLMLSATIVVLNGAENTVFADTESELYYDFDEATGEATLNRNNRYVNIEHVVIPETVVSPNGVTCTVVAIAEKAFGNVDGFMHNESIVSVTIPSTVKTIGQYAFGRCSSLTSVHLSEGLETIDKFAFWKTSVENLIIPESVTFMGQSICEECHYLETVEARSTAPLGDFAFKNCYSLESATIHSAGTGRSAFGGCTSLKNVVMMDGLTVLGDFVFNGDQDLYRIEFPDTLTTMPSNIFNYTSTESSGQMFHFFDENDQELALTVENMKGKVWQKFGDRFMQVTRLMLDGNGGTLTCVADQYIRVKDPVTITNPTRSGYIFGGWDPAIPATMPSTNVSSKAIWKVEVPTPYTEPFIFDNTTRTALHNNLTYTVSGEVSGKDAKKYTATATLTNPENSQWADGWSSASRTIEWEIKPKQVTVEADITIGKQVGAADPDFRNAVSVEGIVPGDSFEPVFTVSCPHPECKGTYEIVVTGARYQGNYDISFHSGNVFLIEAHEIHKPVAKTGLVYDGNEHWGTEPGVGYDLTGEFKGTNSTTVTGHSYKATATLKTGYQWIESPEERDPLIIEWTIAQKPVTVKSVIPISKSYLSGDPDLKTSIVIEGLIGSDAIEYNISREAGENVGKYTIDVSGNSSQGNYKITFYDGVKLFSIVSNVIEKPVARTGLVYNGLLQIGVPAGVGYTLSGEFKGTNATEFVGHTYKANVTIEDGYEWSDSPTERDPFIIEWSIAQKPVDVIVKHRVVKEVGASDPANFDASVVVEGTLGTDTVSFTTSRADGEVIGDYLITVAGDTSQGNYTVTFQSAEKFYIEGEKIPRPVAKTGLIYNGHEQIGVAELPEAYTITGNRATDATRATPYTATVTIKVGYEWETTSSRDPYNIDWTIAPLDIRVRADKELVKNVWDTDPDFNDSVTVHGLVNNFAVSYQAACTHEEAIGEYDITVTGAAEQGNYNVTFYPGHHMFTIKGTVIDKPAPVQVTYDSTVKTGVPSGTGYTITGNTSTDATRGQQNVATANLDVGFEWTGSPGVRECHIPWEIYPAKLVVRANNQVVQVGEPAQPFTVSFEGFKGTDDISVLTQNSPTFTCSYTAGSPAGDYDIILGGTFSAKNYDFILEDGEINCGDIKIDKPLPIHGLAYAGHPLIAITDSYGFTVTGNEATLPGDYIAVITPKAGYSWSDNTTGPFELPWTISKASLTIIADDQEVYVGDPAGPYTVTANGFVDGEGMSDLDGTLLIECSYTTSSPAGKYPIVPSGVSSDNYDIKFENGTLTATNHDPRPKPVPVIPVTVTFGSTAGGHVSADSMTVPLNSKVSLNGSMLIIGSGSSAKVVKAIADAGYAFDSWSVEDGQHILKDTDITASFKTVTISDVAVWETPDKVTYAEGDMFEPKGMKIMVTYNDGSAAIVGYEGSESEFSFSPSLDTPLKPSDIKVSMTYGGHTTEISITVTGMEGEPFPVAAIVLIIAIVAVIGIIGLVYSRTHRNN